MPTLVSGSVLCLRLSLVSHALNVPRHSGWRAERTWLRSWAHQTLVRCWLKKENPWGLLVCLGFRLTFNLANRWQNKLTGGVFLNEEMTQDFYFWSLPSCQSVFFLGVHLIREMPKLSAHCALGGHSPPQSEFSRWKIGRCFTLCMAASRLFEMYSVQLLMKP